MGHCSLVVCALFPVISWGQHGMSKEPLVGSAFCWDAAVGGQHPLPHLLGCVQQWPPWDDCVCAVIFDLVGVSEAHLMFRRQRCHWHLMLKHPAPIVFWESVGVVVVCWLLPEGVLVEIYFWIVLPEITWGKLIYLTHYTSPPFGSKNNKHSSDYWWYKIITHELNNGNEMV